MASVVLTVMSDDRPGLVAAIADEVRTHGGSWQRSEMARLAGKFAGIVLVDLPDDRLAALESSLAGLAHAGVTVAVERSPGSVAGGAGSSGGGASPGTTTTRLAIVGTDRPGIVAEISGALAARGVGIHDLTTEVHDAPMAGGTIFDLRAALTVPAGLDEADLRSALEPIADELMVDLELGAEAEEALR